MMKQLIRKRKKKNEVRLKKSEKKHIKKRKGIKLALAKRIVKIYSDVDIAHFEIGYVTIRRDNFVIRVCQHIHEQDLGDLHIDEEALATERNETRREEKRLRPFKNYCYELYATNREEIERILFEHYFELNQKKFKIIYHKEYPNENKTAKILKDKSAFRNLVHGASGEVDMDAEEDDEYEEDGDGDGDTTTNDGTTTTKRKRKKRKKVVQHHRDQFKEAYKILQEEVTKFRHIYDENECVP